MKLFGLTGGIGMGKSTSDRLLRDRGVAVVDTDLLARQVVEPGQPALEEILHAFGPAMAAPDGRLNRHELARRVFADPVALKQLEGILHPRIRRLWKDQVAAGRAENLPCAVVVIPLLFETDAATEFDAVICVACSAATQLKRLHDRGWDNDQITKRQRAQMPVEKKLELSNYVVWTEGTLDVHAGQLRRIIP